MTNERIAVEALGRCRFAPGTWDKKFARNIADTPEDTRLTAKQREWLWRLTKKYRRQMPKIAVQEAERWLGRHPEEAMFQAALDDNPADFSLRGVFADWLDEHGREAEAAAQRWLAAEQVVPRLVPCGVSYGPDGQKPINYEWSFGMKAWEKFSCTTLESDYLAYYHRSREAAEAALAKALMVQTSAP